MHFSIFKAYNLRISLLSEEIYSGSIKNVWSLRSIAQINFSASDMQAGTNFHLFLKLMNHSPLFVSIALSIELAPEITKCI